MALRLPFALLGFCLAAASVAAPLPEPEPATPDAAAAKAKAKPRRYADLKSGVYDCQLAGMLCTSCAGIVSEEVARVDGVEKADVDFEKRVLRVVIAPKRVVRLDAIKRGLARAERRIDLGSRLVIGNIRYIP